MACYSSIAFDLDGTLLDTLADLHDALDRTLVKMGFESRSVEQARLALGDGVARLVERSIPGGRENPRFDEALATFRRDYAANDRIKTAPYPDIPELLDRLRQRGYRLAVVSNKFDAAVRELSDACFPGVFDFALGAREGIALKPAPDMLEIAMDGLGVSPDSLLYVGDSDTDIGLARAAGTDSVSVSWGFRSRAFLDDHGASAIIDEPLQLLDVLDGRG